MNVAYFGTGSRRLFGIYEPPPTARASNRGIVLCPPWGSEYLMSHRSLRQLALMLTKRGMHVLRFDYFGTGDSAGEMHEVSLAGCESDIVSAVDELREFSRAEQISLLGLRLGAGLAARVSARRPNQFHDLVLWDPIVSGPDYLAELTQKSASKAVHRAPSEIKGARWMRFVNAWGFPVSETIQAELGELDLTTILPAIKARTLVATTEVQPRLEQVQQTLAAQDSTVKFEHLPSPSAWREQGNLGAAAVPTALLNTITSWLIE